MIRYPREYNARKEAVFAAIGAVAGGCKPLPRIPICLRDWPETHARVETALQRAKRRPQSWLGRWVKRQLVRSHYNWARRHFADHPEDVAVAWNGLTGNRKAFLDGARDAGATVLHAELAPLPNRITLDHAGVNAESSVPRDPVVYSAWAAQDPGRSSDRWRAMGAGLVARKSRRRDVAQTSGGLPDGPFLFCPLQVPNDSQITLFASWAGSIEGFLAALAAAAARLPSGWHLRLKEHPSARSSLAAAIAPVLATGRAVLDNQGDSFEQLAASRGVVTINSSMALQAFFFDKPVIVTGQAFFALPGLTQVAGSAEEMAALFHQPDRLTFDASLRAAFMNWLDQEYYAGFTHAEGKTTCDPRALERALQRAQQARRILKR